MNKRSTSFTQDLSNSFHSEKSDNLINFKPKLYISKIIPKIKKNHNISLIEGIRYPPPPQTLNSGTKTTPKQYSILSKCSTKETKSNSSQSKYLSTVEKSIRPFKAVEKNINSKHSNKGNNKDMSGKVKGIKSSKQTSNTFPLKDITNYDNSSINRSVVITEMNTDLKVQIK
jgi:hypothetical protein